MVEQMAAWVNGALISPDGYLSPAVFESSLVLYQTPLQGSFVLSVIDGSARPAPFRVPSGSGYCELIRVVQRVSADERAYWFYGTDPDNALSLLSWVHQCHYDHALDYRLESFETEPAAQGGNSWLGLAGEIRRLREHSRPDLPPIPSALLNSHHSFAVAFSISSRKSLHPLRPFTTIGGCLRDRRSSTGAGLCVASGR